MTVDTITTSTTSSGTADAHVVVGEVTVNGQPVNITDQGLTIQQQQPVPCPATPSPPPGAPSPPAVPSPPGLPPLHGDRAGSAGTSEASSCVPGIDITYIKIFTAQPTKTVDGSHATAWATGLHIVVTHPTPGPGVPQQSTEYVLGEGYADANAGAGGGFAGLGGFGGFGDFSGASARAWPAPPTAPRARSPTCSSTASRWRCCSSRSRRWSWLRPRPGSGRGTRRSRRFSTRS